MSFASEVKKELTQTLEDTCCARAELSALVRMNGTIQLADRKFVVDVNTENAAIARRIYSLVKELYKINSELLVRKKMRLKKNNVYIVRLSVGVQSILKDLSIVGEEEFDFTPGIDEKLIKKSCCKRSYLRGAFLAGGSVNNPEGSSYHLEIFSMYQEHSQDLCELANSFHVNAKVIERKKGYVMYIKEGEKITEFLSLIGAHNALFRFEDVRIVKDMRNSVNRLVNCETANLNKTISASLRQIENIKLIEKEMGLDQLSPRLRDVAVLRLQHPDINLTELGEMIPGGKVSKSGVNHRLRKLDEIAEKLRAKD